MTKPRIGQSLASLVDNTTVIVVRAPADAAAELSVTCGGVEMKDPKQIQPEDRTELKDDEREPTQLGKRYVDAEDTLEVLCTKPGQGRLAWGGAALAIKAAKPLPASD